jgi:hypothetical protein
VQNSLATSSGGTGLVITGAGAAVGIVNLLSHAEVGLAAWAPQLVAGLVMGWVLSEQVASYATR